MEHFKSVKVSNFVTFKRNVVWLCHVQYLTGFTDHCYTDLATLTLISYLNCVVTFVKPELHSHNACGFRSGTKAVILYIMILVYNIFHMPYFFL